MGHEAALQRYTQQLAPDSSPSLRNLAQKFCVWAAERELGTRAVLDWVKLREAAGFAPGTIDYEVRVLRRLFKVNNLIWEVRPHQLPQITERDEYAPSLDPALIEALIRATAKLAAAHRAHLAMASAYGLRRTELAAISREDFDLGAQTVFIETAKAGRQRYHLVAPEIASHVRVYPWPPRTVQQVSRLAADIKRAAGFIGKEYAEIGWHALRRSATQALLRAGFADWEVHQYLRWKRSRSNMPERYGATVVIGAGGRSERQPGLQDADLDRRAFAALPWLQVWREVLVVERP